MIKKKDKKITKSLLGPFGSHYRNLMIEEKQRFTGKVNENSNKFFDWLSCAGEYSFSGT